VRTIVAERWAVLRYGLAAVLGRGGHEVVRTVATADAAAAVLAVRHDIDLVLLGATDRPASEALAVVRAAAPTARVVVLADRPTPSDIEELLADGAMVVLERGSERTDLARAVDRLAAADQPHPGEPVPDAVGPVLPELELAPDGSPAELTTREREILSWLARGASAQEVATQLFIGQAALSAHEAAIYRKLGAANRDQAIARAMHLGLLGNAVTWDGGKPEEQRAS
jgi:DNA-binding NarL/FixJ family response regulator